MRACGEIFRRAADLRLRSGPASAPAPAHQPSRKPRPDRRRNPYSAFLDAEREAPPKPSSAVKLHQGDCLEGATIDLAGQLLWRSMVSRSALPRDRSIRRCTDPTVSCPPESERQERSEPGIGNMWLDGPIFHPPLWRALHTPAIDRASLYTAENVPCQRARSSYNEKDTVRFESADQTPSIGGPIRNVVVRRGDFPVDDRRRPTLLPPAPCRRDPPSSTLISCSGRRCRSHPECP